MKKFTLILFLTLLLSAISVSAYAFNDEYSKYEAYGLCVVSKILEYDENFDMNKNIDRSTYSDIMNLWFGTNINTDTNPTNSDAVYALSYYAPKNIVTPNTITSFKDYGFIKKEHRSAYKTMHSAGFLNNNSEYLKPNYPLTYASFFDMLIHFEDNFIYKNGFKVSEGKIADSFSDGNSIVLKQTVDKNEVEFKFNRMHTFYVQSGEKISPYSYNIKRGNNAKIYLSEGSIVFVSIKDETSSFEKKYDTINAKIYLCNPYENTIILTNIQTGSYMIYTYDDDSLIFENKIKKTFEDINDYYTDRNSIIITEKNSKTIKYINITG